MSICEHMSGDSMHSTTARTPEEKLKNIQNELIWGLTYRNYKENEKKKPMAPMHSPINIPFELCRAEMLKIHRKKPKVITSNKIEEQEIRAQAEETADEKSVKQRPKKRKLPIEKPTLLDRNVWSQNKYMDYLSLPNPKFYEEPKQKKYKKRCELEPCPPRFIQLAVPNKRRVYANWKDYADVLPTEMLMRYDEILHTDQNLDPKEARYYYKKLDRQKRQERKKKKREEKKKKQQKELDADWLKDSIASLSKYIVNYIQDEPLLALNYKQMMLSDGILDRLDETKIMKKPSRKTKNHYKKTVIEVSDKMAVWIDTLTRFVDVQAIDDDDDIPPLSIPSLQDEGEEGESDYESTTDEELDDDKFFPPEFGEEEGLADESENAENLVEDIFKPGKGEGVDDLENVLNGLNGDILEKLIIILSKCSDEFLDRLIDDIQLPNTTYRNVLERLKELRNKLQPKEGEKSFLEQIMIDWAMKNDPDNVNDKVLDKIREVAAILEDMLAQKPSERRFEQEDKEEDEKKVGREEEEVDKGTENPDVADEESKNAIDAGKEGTKDEENPEDQKEGDEEERKEEENPEDKKEDGEEEYPEDKNEGAEAAEEEDAIEKKEGEDAEVKDKEDEEANKEGKDEGDDEVKSPEDEFKESPSQEDAAKIPSDEKGTDDTEDKPQIEDGDEEKQDGDEEETPAEKGITDETKSEREGDDVIKKPTDSKVKVSSKDKISPSKEVIKPSEDKPTEPSSSVRLIQPPSKERPPDKDEDTRLCGKIIKAHRPTKVNQHKPDTVCCLSLKTWAVWLLEITHNAHNWTQWMSCVIQKVREYASIVRGDINESDGKVKVLKKAEWRSFIKETEESIIAWRQYSSHVKDLSQNIVDNFHDKSINCCPKCLQDHLISNVVVAHETLQALTEAISCAAYWQRCLDALVDKTCKLTEKEPAADQKELPDLEQEQSSTESQASEAILEDVIDSRSMQSGESVYEIEGFDFNKENN